MLPPREINIRDPRSTAQVNNNLNFCHQSLLSYRLWWIIKILSHLLSSDLFHSLFNRLYISMSISISISISIDIDIDISIDISTDIEHFYCLWLSNFCSLSIFLTFNSQTAFHNYLDPYFIHPWSNRNINNIFIQAIFRRWLPLSDAVLRMVVRCMPSPLIAQNVSNDNLLININIP